MNNTKHYESAFETLLQQQHLRYDAVDHAWVRRFVQTGLKSFDFIVHTPGGRKLLVDVKGRKLQILADGSCRWQNWVTLEDVTSLVQWQQALGSGCVGMFVFAYWLPVDFARTVPEDICRIDNRWYAFLAVAVDDYRSRMRLRSRRWQTVHVPTRFFRDAARPFGRLLLKDT